MKDVVYVLISAMALLAISNRMAYVKPGKEYKGWLFAGVAWGVIFVEHLWKLH